MTTYDIAVVGGGIGGLVAATSAALEGARVAVLEGGKELGGRGRSESEAGFTRNLGPHALYLGGGLDRALGRLGVKVKGGVVGGSGGRVLDGAELRPMPSSALAIPFARWLSPRERATLMGAFARISLESPKKHRHESAEEYLASITTGRERALLRALIRVATYGGDLSLMSAECAISQVQSALLSGVMYLDGGWQSLVDGLTARARAAGVAIHTGTAVRAIDGDGPFVLRLDDAQIAARSVIVVSSPRTASELVERGRGPLAEFASTAIPVTAACLDVRVLPGRSATTGLVLGLDAPLYVQDHARYARLAPEGGAMVHAARYADGSACDPVTVRAELESAARAALGLGDDAPLDARFLPRCIVHHALVTKDLGGFAGRPGVSTTRPGIFVAGDWVGDAGLLADATAASGTRAARLALSFLAESPETRRDAA